MRSTYQPSPIDTADVRLPAEIFSMVEALARNTHENWSAARIKEGWTYGANRDDFSKQTPCLVPYELLPDSEKNYDRAIAEEILKVIFKVGFKIVVKIQQMIDLKCTF